MPRRHQFCSWWPGGFGWGGLFRRHGIEIKRTLNQCTGLKHGADPTNSRVGSYEKKNVKIVKFHNSEEFIELALDPEKWH